jgi:hypothetical protein
MYLITKKIVTWHFREKDGIDVEMRRCCPGIVAAMAMATILR